MAPYFINCSDLKYYVYAYGVHWVGPSGKTKRSAKRIGFDAGFPIGSVCDTAVTSVSE